MTVGDITGVLDETLVGVHRDREGSVSSKKIFEMLDLFYANKHMYEKFQRKERV